MEEATPAEVINVLKRTGMTGEAVSYTHLDVYKRQGQRCNVVYFNS